MPKNIRDILNPLVKFSTWKNSISVRENHLLSQRFFDDGSLITRYTFGLAYSMYVLQPPNISDHSIRVINSFNSLIPH